MTVDDADWTAQRLYIREELKSLRADVREVGASLNDLREKDLSQIRVEIAMLQVKSGIWGFIAGGLVALIPVIIKMAG